MWILVKVLSFGIVSEMFSILKKEDKVAIAELYNVNEKELETFLPILANYRNLCAHEDILYDNRTQKEIPNSIYHDLLHIEKSEEGIYVNGKNDLFALVLIMKELLKEGEFTNMMNEIDHIIESLSMNLKVISVDKILKKMGFPKNYIDISNIERSGLE